MKCQKKTATGSKCLKQAYHQNEIGTSLCPIHFAHWIDRLHNKNRAYYKGVVRRREEILHFIWMDCKRASISFESTLMTILDNTNYTKRELILYFSTIFDKEHEVFLEKYPNWRELISPKR